MKKTLLLVLIASILLTGFSYAYTVTHESTLKDDTFKSMLPGKRADIGSFALVKNKGTIFTLVRDEKTRNLEWVLINPAKKTVIAKGACPFKAFLAMDASPAGNGALVFTRYPTTLMHLNLETKQWTQLYKNPGNGQKGLALISISPITYAETYRAFSVMDMWDAEHFVVGTFVASFMPGTGKLEEVVSLDNLVKASTKAVFSTPPAGMLFKTDLMRFAEDKSFTYILKSKPRNKPSGKNYLLAFQAPGKVTVLDQADGKILPLDYIPSPSKTLYTVFAKDTTTVFFKDGDKKEQILEEKGLVGKIMKDDLIGVATVEGKTFNIYLGHPGSKLKKVLALPNMYAAGFVNDGSRFILANKNEIRVYKISK